MTIACCLVSPEGVVFGADSTITTEIDGKCHFMNHNQKIFEVGQPGTYAVMTWGLTAFKDISYRTLIARLGDKFAEKAPESGLDAANIWSGLVWEAYTKSFSKEIDRFRTLYEKISRRTDEVRSRPTKRSKAEDAELNGIYNDLKVGFCIGGYSKKFRTAQAYYIELNPSMRSQAFPNRIERFKDFGKDDIVSRIFGVFDDEIKEQIVKSAHWSGEKSDLESIISAMRLDPPPMTMRDSIDFVHFRIYSTIKATKFSTRDNDCGGPIELAIITTDRDFRWVKHKSWDSAINDWGI